MVDPATARSRNKLKYLSATIRGTTFTGHPTRTTDGNTKRMYYYTAYLATKANIPSSQFYSIHSGDDVVAIINSDYLKAFYATVSKYILHEKVETYIERGYDQ